jgi:hypothetical protein
MNVRILGNAMAVQRRNDQKVVNCACAKAQREVSEQLLHVLGFNVWGMGSMP